MAITTREEWMVSRRKLMAALISSMQTEESLKETAALLNSISLEMKCGLIDAKHDERVKVMLEKQINQKVICFSQSMKIIHAIAAGDEMYLPRPEDVVALREILKDEALDDGSSLPQQTASTTIEGGSSQG